MGNIVPEGVHHRCKQDVKIRGITIPQNTVIAPLFGEVMKGDHWDDAETFNPERFLDENGEI